MAIQRLYLEIGCLVVLDPEEESPGIGEGTAPAEPARSRVTPETQLGNVVCGAKIQLRN